MTEAQQKKVTDNMGLVNKVIREKVHSPYNVGMFTYDDLYQIGCVGLCKAATTDKGGTFSTYAYRLIWNEICDALIYATRRQSHEILIEDEEQLADYHTDMNYEEKHKREVTRAAVEKAKDSATPFVARCIDVLLRHTAGETCKEIGATMGISDKQVAAYVSKARKYLKSHPDMQMAASL